MLCFTQLKRSHRSFFKLDPDPHWKERLDPDPQKMNADLQPWNIEWQFLIVNHLCIAKNNNYFIKSLDVLSCHGTCHNRADVSRTTDRGPTLRSGRQKLAPSGGSQPAPNSFRTGSSPSHCWSPTGQSCDNSIKPDNWRSTLKEFVCFTSIISECKLSWFCSCILK